MVQTLLASLWALATLVVYQLASDRWDGMSLRRQQLDAWAALSALMALGLILHGGSRASGAVLPAPLPAAPAPAPSAHTQAAPAAPDAAFNPLPASQPADTRPALLDGGAAADAAAAVDHRAATPVAGDHGDPVAPRAASDPAADPAPLTDLPAAPGAQQPPAVDPPATADPVDLVGVVPVRPAVTPTAVPVRPVVAPPVIRPISPTQAPEPTVEAPPATVDPAPICGDPRALKVSLSILEAQAERGGQQQVVRFRADLKNESGFPVVATGMVAVAQDGRSSADQFGVERLPDVQIEALRSLVLEGRVALEKQPSPMSRSELCISFVAETCGLRGDSPLTRRCFNIGGF
jgi:hypothetical protein